MEIKRLFDYLYHQQSNHQLERSFGRRHGEAWKFFSTAEIIEHSRRLGSGLISMGILPGDKVSIVAYSNRPEWVIADMAIQQIGAVSVPLYPTISSKEYKYILNEADVKLAIAGSGDLYEKLKLADIDSLEYIIMMDKTPDRYFWLDVENDDNIDQLEKISVGVKGDDLATIIYTSGTTGNPKGVMLTHKNIISAVDNTMVAMPLSHESVVVSFLPFCHIFERAVIYAYLYHSAIVYCTGTDNLGGPTGDLATIKPHMFTTVPRLLEKVYEKIYNKGLDLTGLKKKLFFWALDLTDHFEMDTKQGLFYRMKMSIANKLIFSKWREALGGNLRAIVTGAAPCPEKIARVFSAAQIPIIEGYGLTETSPTLSINRYGGKGAKLGTVGPIIDCVDIMIDPSDGDYRDGEGEILADGPNVMIGYYKKPEKTDEVFVEKEGRKWFRTGDIGKLVDGPHGYKYLKITDRKKELLKTSGGKYVAPAPIENRFKEDFLIEQIMVVGDKQKFVSALIVPAEEPLKEWCEENDVNYLSLSEVIRDSKVIARYQACCDRFNPDFSHIEQIKKVKLIDKTWEATRIDGTDAELTPTMKLKRRVIRQKYAKEIDEMYR